MNGVLLPQTLDDAIVRAVAAAPDRPALLSRARTMTYRDVGAEIERLAAEFTRSGVAPGHKVAVLAVTSIEQVLAILAALRCGAMVSLMSATLSQSDCERRLATFDPAYLVRARPGEIQLTAGGRSRQRARFPRTLVFWTGGSTGIPKGIVHDERAVVWNAATNAGVLGLGPADRALIVLDGSYCYALVHQVFSHLAVGGSIAWPTHPLWLPDLADHISDLSPTTLAVVPAVLQAVVNTPGVIRACSSLRLLTVGGGAATPALLARTRMALPTTEIVLTYGLTEAGPRVCTRPYDPLTARRGLVGTPLPGVDVRVTDGELFVRTPSGCIGRMIEGEVQPSSGWIATGDMASIEADGQVRLIGRLKRVINRGGVKIEIDDIEAAFTAHPDVAQVRVLPFEHARLGEVPRAFVVSRPGTELDPESLAHHCLDRLKLTSIPVDIQVVTALPPAPTSWKDQQVEAVTADYPAPAGQPAPANVSFFTGPDREIAPECDPMPARPLHGRAQALQAERNRCD